MTEIVKGSKITASTLHTVLKEKCNALLPSSGYYDRTTSLPYGLSGNYLQTRAEMINWINTEIDGMWNEQIKTGEKVYATHVFQWMSHIFKCLGCCRKLYWYDRGTQAPGSQDNAQTVASWGQTGGTWTYFKPSFAWEGNVNYLPRAVSNANTNNTGYQPYPLTGTNWQNNTRLSTATGQILTVNQIIKAVEGANQQITNFTNEWNNRNNNAAYWNGNSEDTSNTSNRVLFVRYWCHTNCHSNCHSNCHGSRSRR